jgi:hypothetical protein
MVLQCHVPQQFPAVSSSYPETATWQQQPLLRAHDESFLYL